MRTGIVDRSTGKEIMNFSGSIRISQLFSMNKVREKERIREK
ncbi:MAG: hypothetical protein ACYDDV_12460 [Methanoregula sp.]